MQKSIMITGTIVTFMAGVLALHAFAATGRPAVVAVHASLRHSYDSLDELTAQAPLIVIADVTGSAAIPYQNLPFTKSTVKVRQVIKGDVADGAVLSVLETGGQWKGKAKGNVQAAKTTQELALEGIPVMKPRERYLLFLTPYVGKVATDAYIPAGEFQGKFKIGVKGTFVFTGSNVDAPDPQFAIHRSVTGRAEADVLSEVRALLKP